GSMVRLATTSSTHDSFLGRQREMEQIDGLLAAGARLITITGTAGVGKTRLAREIAQAPREVVGFCELTEARSLEDVCAGVARALAIELSSEGGDLDRVVRQIGHALAARHPARTPSRSGPLLVLDNLEQVIAAAAP